MRLSFMAAGARVWWNDPFSIEFLIAALLPLLVGRMSKDQMRRRLYLATIARIMSPAFSAWSAMEAMISASLTK